MEWNGARWWKCDFHTHTPASKDYGKGSEQERLKWITPRAWLLNYMGAGVDCVAITDHNSGAWIDRIKSALAELESEKPDGFRPLYVFPGVEISSHGGVHLLAILGRDKTTEDVDYLLHDVGFPYGERGTSHQVTTKPFPEVAREIDKAGGIAIPAHVDRCSGIFEEISGTTLGQILADGQIFSMELTDPSYTKPQLYVDRKMRWTEILGSDAHHPPPEKPEDRDRYPGSHFTWVKMGSPSIEGLRLALLDGALSIRRSDEYEEDPNKYPSLVLEAIEVSDARYMGRSAPFSINFNPWFNAIIGGRGTGKSSTVEFLRNALRRKDELRGEIQIEFEQYDQVYTNRNDPGLLTRNANLRVICRKRRGTVSRPMGTNGCSPSYRA